MSCPVSETSVKLSGSCVSDFFPGSPGEKLSGPQKGVLNSTHLCKSQKLPYSPSLKEIHDISTTHFLLSFFLCLNNNSSFTSFEILGFTKVSRYLTYDLLGPQMAMGKRQPPPVDQQ